jgi:KipI family sensor histidine kinase inhibitor
MTNVGVRRAGDRGALLEVPDGTAARVAQQIGVELGEGLVDVVPGHRTVLVTWEADPPSDDELTVLAVRAIDSPDSAAAPRTVEIPVTYDGADLETVAELAGLSVADVVRAHTASEYTAAFLGFQPGFAYLLGGDERLHVQRRDEPRQRVPAGSVAVAGPYSGVYPRESPGGWQLLGTTATVLFDPDARPPALLSAGDRVRFVAA